MARGTAPTTTPAPAAPPAGHLDLLERPLVAALTTLLPDGRPQTQPVWFSYDPPAVLVNTMRGFRKERNMRADPRVSLVAVDPADSGRWIELRGLVELIDDGARAHLDLLAQRYAGAARFFGGCVSVELAEHEIPVIGRVRPTRWVDERSADLLASARPATRPPSPTTLPRAVPPVSHQDLLTWPLTGILSTLLPGGHPQAQPVGFGWDGHQLTIETTPGQQKARNLLRDPRATLLIVDPADSSRWMEVRADAEIVEGGAAGGMRSVALIVYRLSPVHVVCDAIHRPGRPAAHPTACLRGEELHE